MSLAAETRAAVRARPWLHRALRAGVVNYAAAAESLDVEGDRDAIATALRRFGGDLPDAETDARDVTVRMRSGVGLVSRDGDAAGGDGETAESGDRDGEAAGSGDGDRAETIDPDAEPLAAVGGERLLPGGGGLTAIVVDGDVDAAALSAVVDRLAAENVVVDAAGVAGERLVVAVPRSDGATALRLVEDALTAVPTV